MTIDPIRISLETVNRSRARIGLPPLRQRDLGWVDGRPDPEPRRGGLWWTAWILLAALAFLGAIALLAPRAERARPMPRLESMPGPCFRATPAPSPPSRPRPAAAPAPRR
jgi:hypothetical protein